MYWHFCKVTVRYADGIISVEIKAGDEMRWIMIHMLFIDNIVNNFVSQFNLFIFLFVTVQFNAKDGLKEIKISSRISLRILAGHCYDLP